MEKDEVKLDQRCGDDNFNEADDALGKQKICGLLRIKLIFIKVISILV